MPVITLTSIPSRFEGLPVLLESLLAQRPSAVSLAIPHRYLRFPAWDGALPALPSGISLHRVVDEGPATKFVTAFRLYRDTDVLVLDDDCDYGPGLVPSFRSARALNPRAAVAGSVFDSGRLGLPRGHAIVQGFAGLLLKPSRLAPTVSAPDRDSRWADDLWLSAKLAESRVEIVSCPETRRHTRPRDLPDQLQHATIGGLSRAALNRTVARRLRRNLNVWQGDKPAAPG